MADTLYRELPLGAQKKIALVAHDSRKAELIAWVKAHQECLSHHQLSGTGTTATLIAKATGLPVKAYRSGPLGGDQQIGAGIVVGDIDMLIFFWDPLEAQPHDPDVKALLRITAVYNIPVADNEATADFILSSPLMNNIYVRKTLDYDAILKKRVADVY